MQLKSKQKKEINIKMENDEVSVYYVHLMFPISEFPIFKYPINSVFINTQF